MAINFYNPLVVSIGPVVAGTPQTFTAMRPIAVVDALASVTTAAIAVTTMTITASTGAIIPTPIDLGNNAQNKVGRAVVLDGTKNKIAAGGTLTFTQLGNAGATNTSSRVSVIGVAF